MGELIICEGNCKIKNKQIDSKPFARFKLRWNGLFTVDKFKIFSLKLEYST